MYAQKAGIANATTVPAARARASMCHGSRMSRAIRRAWIIETMASPMRTKARSFRLSNRSAMAPAKMGKTRMGSARMPETRPTQRFEPVRSYITQDCAAVRATAPMSKRAWEASRRVKPGMASTRRRAGMDWGADMLFLQRRTGMGWAFLSQLHQDW